MISVWHNSFPFLNSALSGKSILGKSRVYVKPYDSSAISGGLAFGRVTYVGEQAQLWDGLGSKRERMR